MDAVDVGSEGLSDYIDVTLQEVLDKFDVVSAGDVAEPYLVVVSRGSIQLAGPPNIDSNLGIAELGYTSLSPWTAWTRQERVPELRAKLGIRKWYDMKRNDGAIRGSLNLIKTPIRSAHWFVEPGEDTTAGHSQASFIEDCLFNELNVDWGNLLDDVLLMFEYGYMPFEKVYKFRNDGKLVLQKLAPRHPLDIMEWIYDDRGGPAGLVMEPFVPYGNQNNGIVTPSFPIPQDYGNLMGNMGTFIPIRKLVIFSFEPEAGDLSGISILRSAYKHWYYKDTLYKIDAIQKERHGIGVPVIILPPGYSKDDKALAEELGRNLRTNDRAHIVIPSNWQITFAKLEGQPVSAIESIKHHNDQIKINILAPFMDANNATTDAQDLFFKSTRYLANMIAGYFNKYVIQQLIDLNFSRGQKYPKLRARRIGEWNDLRTLSFALRNFVGAGLITPDDVLEAQLRDESDLPHQDFATSRVMVGPPLQHIPSNQDIINGTGSGAPQTTPTPGGANVPNAPAPPRVGLPRQAAPTNDAGKANTGLDRSGGPKS